MSFSIHCQAGVVEWSNLDGYGKISLVAKHNKTQDIFVEENDLQIIVY